MVLGTPPTRTMPFSVGEWMIDLSTPLWIPAFFAHASQSVMYSATGRRGFGPVVRTARAELKRVGARRREGEGRGGCVAGGVAAQSATFDQPLPVPLEGAEEGVRHLRVAAEQLRHLLHHLRGEREARLLVEHSEGSVVPRHRRLVEAVVRWLEAVGLVVGAVVRRLVEVHVGHERRGAFTHPSPLPRRKRPFAAPPPPFQSESLLRGAAYVENTQTPSGAADYL